MFTRCPSCRAAFSISQQQLEIAAGVVRCGMCEHVFDAKLFLFNQPLEQDAQETESEQPHPQQDETGNVTENNNESDNEPTVDIELTAQDNSTIDLDILDRELQAKNDDAELSSVTNIVDSVDEIAKSDNQIEQDTDSSTPEADANIPKIIADQVSSLEQEPRTFNPTHWLGVMLIMALIVVAGVQFIAAFKPDLIAKQYQSTLCKWISCRVDTPRALNKIEVLNRSIYTHPSENQALMVTLTIINRADFSQAYPVIQLHFLNISGEVIAARRFSANHYLREKWSSGKLMPAATPLSIQLEVHDVGEEVVSYNFDFL